MGRPTGSARLGSSSSLPRGKHFLTRSRDISITNPGQTCCVFRHWRDNDKGEGFDIEQVRLEALELLGRGDGKKHEISVLGRFGGYGVCIANWDGGPGKSFLLG